MLLKLTYSIARNPYKRFVFISDAEAIRNLLWQLTRNYRAYDGTAIGNIEVTNLDGIKLEHNDVYADPFAYVTNLSTGPD